MPSTPQSSDRARPPTEPATPPQELPQEPRDEQDLIDEAAAESFPASDPPSFTGAAATPSAEPSETQPAPGADDRHPT